MIRNQLTVLIVIATLMTVVGLSGCRATDALKDGLTRKVGKCETGDCGGTSLPIPGGERISYANLDCPVQPMLQDTAPPLTGSMQLPDAELRLSLDDAISIAFQNTEILRGLGARVLDNPQGVAGVFDPAIQSTDPLFGVDAALSQFDAQMTAGLTYANNDKVFNNAVIGGGANEIQQDLATGTFGLQKTAATGTQFSINTNVQYDDNNRPANLFNSSYTTLFEAQARQPLLQGSGLAFNRIAGPNARPGFRGSSGVLIARINNDISIAQFEKDVRGFVDEVIGAYWQLYLAYRNFESAKTARDSSQKTWNIVKARFDNDLPGGEADKEAQAREQYYLFQGRLMAALNGDERTGTVGVLQAEANLRRLLNLPQSDGMLIRPAEEPEVGSIVYDWDMLVHNALNSRVELREQAWRIKQRELELFASQNFTKPRLDAVATYRNNGFGDTLGRSGNSPFDSALQVASDGLYDEWEVGLQMNVPVGFRQASAGVRNAELQLQRERAVLREQQKQILHDMGTALRQAEQSQVSVRIAAKRMNAAQQTVDSRQAAFDADSAPFDELLDGQQRLADAENAFYRELVSWARSTESVSREAGRLLVNHGIILREADAPNFAGSSATVRQAKLSRGLTDYRMSSPGPVER